MESTDSDRKKSPSTQWFIVNNETLIGPLEESELVQLAQKGEISPVSFAWRKSLEKWTPLYEIQEFQSLLPSKPSPALLEEAKKRSIKPPKKTNIRKREWFVYTDHTQYGPFSEDELALVNGISAKSFVWKSGMKNWESIQDIPSLILNFANSSEISESNEKRNMPRHPFHAKILFINNTETGWGLCRDISIGGVQLLIDNPLVSVGDKLKLNISAEGYIPAFTCSGEVVRMLENHRGFSFRFEGLPETAQKAIEKYNSK